MLYYHKISYKNSLNLLKNIKNLNYSFGSKTLFKIEMMLYSFWDASESHCIFASSFLKIPLSGVFFSFALRRSHFEQTLRNVIVIKYLSSIASDSLSINAPVVFKKSSEIWID